MVRPAFDQLILQGQFWKGSQLVVVLLLRVATDYVVGFLLALVNAEALEALTTVGHQFRASHEGLVVSGRPCGLDCFADGWQFVSGVIPFRVPLLRLIVAAFGLGVVAVGGPHVLGLADPEQSVPLLVLAGHLGEVVICVGVAMVEAAVEIGGLAAWRGEYKVGLE